MPPRVVIYTRKWCGYCVAALSLLDEREIEYEHIDATGNAAIRADIAERSGQRTVPQIFIDGESLGGFRELRIADRDGTLARRLASPSPNPA